MKEVYIYTAKIVTNILFITLTIHIASWRMAYIFPISILFLINTSMLVILIKRSNEFKRRYHRKRYKMQNRYHYSCTISEIVFIVITYWATLHHNSDQISVILLFFIIHLSIIGLLVFALFCDITQYIKRKKINKVSNISYEMGVIKGRVKKDGAVVLEDSELVQIIDRVNEMVTVRKGNGQEFTIKNDILK